MIRLPRDVAFLFDIGNVILFFDFWKFARAIEQDCRLSADEVMREIEDVRHEMESTLMETDDFLRKAFHQIGYRGTREKFVHAWQNIFVPNQPVVDLIGRLADDGHRLILLSNTNQMHVDHFMPTYPVFSRFNGAVFSHEAGCAKPDPAIYEHAIREHRLDPARTIYIDDILANVEAGERAGLRGVLYENQPVEELERIIFKAAGSRQ